ncbi:MAG TPA: hypothetical protein VNG53_06595, partial [Bacteroidia bacterium]|nr:hypothetical protein [Bacteroidia bacterium]
VNALLGNNLSKLGRPLGWKNLSLNMVVLVLFVILCAKFMNFQESDSSNFWEYVMLFGVIGVGAFIFSLKKRKATDTDYKEKIKVRFTAKVKSVKSGMSYYNITLNAFGNPYSEDKLMLYGSVVKATIKENQDYIFEVAKKSGIVLNVTPVQKAVSEI